MRKAISPSGTWIPLSRGDITFRRASLFRPTRGGRIAALHTALDGPDHFRVLRLLPGKDKQPIKGEFVILSTKQELPKFTAVSYAWGDPSIKHRIECDGEQLGIAESAMSLLRRLRDPEEESLIWVDAVCIDQTNSVERAQQVKLMGQIYSRAEAVVAWLGAHQDDSELLVNFIPKLAFACRNCGLDILTQDPRLPGQETIKGSDIDRDLQRLTGTTLQSPEWRALEQLFTRPWFRRLWVIQEAALNPKLSLIYGDRSADNLACVIDIYELLAITFKVSFMQRKRSIIGSKLLFNGGFGLGMFDGIMIQRDRIIRKQQTLPLDHLHWTHNAAEVTDPKDRIFALLGLDAEFASRLAVNYDDDVHEVYTKATQCFLSAHKSSRIFGLAGTGFGRVMQHASPLPSWVPDYHVRDRAAVPFGLIVDPRFTSYNAGPVGKQQFETDSKTVSVEGIKYDTVELVGAALGARVRPGYQTTSTLDEWLDSAEQLFTHSRYFGTEEASEVLWRSLIADRQLIPRMQSPAPETLGHGYRSLKNPSFYFDRELGTYVSRNSNTHASSSAIREQDIALGQARDFAATIESSVLGYSYCVLSNGDVGIVPPLTQAGDIICVLTGSLAPYVIRPSYVTDEGFQTYELVGDCYIYGIMYGRGEGLGELEKIIIA